MDQLKEYFAVAVKYGFWIGCGVVFLGSLAFWYLSTSKLATEAEKQTASIERDIRTVSQIQAELSRHPNALSHAEMNRLIDDRKFQVLESWETLFDRQSEILVWPEDVLTKRFVDQYRKKIPIEYYVGYPTAEADSLTTSMRSTYAKHIKKELPAIAEIAGSDWTAPFESSSNNNALSDNGRRNFDSMNEDDQMGLKQGPLVVWTEDSQASLLADLFPWRQTGLPNTLEIYYSQENLWVLRQLLEIVGAINGAAKQPYQAKIHEISTIKIGSSVVFGAGKISPPGSNSTSAGIEFGGGLDNIDIGGYASEGTGIESEVPDPANFRYVSEGLEKIAATDLRSALKDVKPQNVALAIAKRLPVMMSLKMNQRAIPELLAACGSAKLMIKVRQTRIMPKGDVSIPSVGEGTSGGIRQNSGISDQPIDEFPLDMQVEIYGLIYIYNPPDLDKLAIEQVNEQTVDQAVQDLSGEAKEPTQPAAAAAEPPAAGGVPEDAVLPVPGANPANPPAPAPAPAPAVTPPAGASIDPVDAPVDAGPPVTLSPTENLTPTG